MRSIVLVLAATGCATSAESRRYDALQVALRGEPRPPPDDRVLSAGVLDRAALIDAVLARNPALDAAHQEWRAIAAGYPAAVALDDPMISYEIAPLSVAGDAPFGQRIKLTQKLPFPGKRRAAGAAAVADAEAAGADYDAKRLELAELASSLFDDYYLADRALEVNAHHTGLLERMKANATAQYTVGRASQQDPLQAEVELIDLERERIELATTRRTVVARINGLLHRPPAAPLPPPPPQLAVDPRLDAPAGAHPTQVAAEARVRAREADVAGARRAPYPDVELMASYDSMWDMFEHQWMIGIAFEIPIQRAGRDAKLAAARAAAARAASELAAARDAIAIDLDRARREVEAAVQTLALDETKLVPAARSRVDAALAGFTVGQNDFQTVISAEQQLRHAELAVEKDRVELDRRLVAAARAAGRVPGRAAGGVR